MHRALFILKKVGEKWGYAAFLGVAILDLVQCFLSMHQSYHLLFMVFHDAL